MVNLFEQSDSRDFVKQRIHQMPKRGYGQASRLAQSLGIHTTLVSQILLKKKHFSLEQATLTADFFGLNDLETDFFVTLVELERAGNESLRKVLRRRLSGIRDRSRDLSQRIRPEKSIQEAAKSIFYSDWVYSAARQLPAIHEFRRLEQIADRLGISRRKARDALNFLVSSGLLEEKDGSFSVGPKSTHLEASSPWVKSHHSNWRQKALESLTEVGPTELHYTGPMTISKSDAAKVRELSSRFIEQIVRLVSASPSEEFYCLNLDWFRLP